MFDKIVLTVKDRNCQSFSILDFFTMLGYCKDQNECEVCGAIHRHSKTMGDTKHDLCRCQKCMYGYG